MVISFLSVFLAGRIRNQIHFPLSLSIFLSAITLWYCVVVFYSVLIPYRCFVLSGGIRFKWFLYGSLGITILNSYSKTKKQT